MEQLTVKQAIEQGYTHFGRAGEDFQHLCQLDSVDVNGIGDDIYEYVLADSKAHHLSIDGDSIWDMVQDSVMASSDFSDDTDAIPDALKEGVPWSEYADKINAVLQNHPYWYLTKIKLVP